MNITETKAALPLIFKSNLTPLVVGRHGTGKSQLMTQIAKEHDAQLFNFRLGTQSDAGDLLGLASFLKDENGNDIATKFMRPEWFPTGGKGILFLDEINRARRDIQQAVFQLVLDKRLHTHVLPPMVFDEAGNWVSGWATVAAMNPGTDEYVVVDMADAAFSDRFAYVKFEPTHKEWMEYARKNGINEDLLSFISVQPDLLESKGTDFSLDVVKPSRRSWDELSKMYSSDVDLNTFLEISLGVIGPVATVALKKHLEEELRRVSGKKILKSFEKHREEVLQLSKDGRSDVLTAITDDIFGLKKEKKYTAKEIENMSQYIMCVPRDLGASIVDRLMDNDEVIEVIGKDERLCKHFTGFKVKVEDEKTV